MSASEEKLIEELYHNVKASGGRPLERRLADLTIWFHKNRATIDQLNLAAKQVFMEKAMWVLIETLALTVERLHVLENERKPGRLWTVRGLSVSGDLRRFG